MSEFTGLRALVTGAGGGLGQVLARTLLEAGAQVALHYHSSRPGAEELQERYPKARAFAADFSSFSLGEWKERVGDWLGGLDLLIHNAAHIENVPLDQLHEGNFAQAYAVNSTTPLLLTQAFLGDLSRSSCPKVLGLSTVGVKYGGSSRRLPYLVSKQALEAGLLALAKHHAQNGILINVLRCGLTDTRAHGRLQRSDLERRIEKVPLGRMAQPEEIVDTALHLLHPRTRFITGTIVEVSGGE